MPGRSTPHISNCERLPTARGRLVRLQFPVVAGFRFRGSLLAAAAVVAVAASFGSARAGDPSLVWKTVETKHFVVSYYEPLDDVARRVAVVAERAHRVLVPRFGHAPSEKTLIVITDDTDSANGFANVLPRDAIHLYASQPGGTSSLNDHDDWLYGLTAHEYTHIIHLDTIEGLPKYYNKVLGKTWAPNQVQPRWVIEGIATYEESKRSSSGRLRQALFDMDLRVHTLAGKTIDLDAISNGARAWPHGTVPYLYGSHFLAYIFDRYGDDKLGQMSRDYGSTPVPWGINRAIEHATGKTFVELYSEWRQYLRARYRGQLAQIERQGRREGRQLTFSGESSYNPVYTRDGSRILWGESDGVDRDRLRVMPVGTNVGKSTIYATISRSDDFRPLADGSLVLTLGARYRSNYDFQDLYRWDVETRRVTRLTSGLRARDVTVSPDERQLAFVVNTHSERQLAIMPLEPEAKPRIIWRGERFDQANTPAWSPDGRQIAFSAWRKGGYRDILVYDLATGKTRALMHDRAQDTDPTWDPRGRYLYYSSDRSGIYNVYAYDLRSGATRQVTNVVGCALSPAVSPDGKRMVYQGFDVGGYDIYEIDLVESRWLDPLPYVNNRPNPTVIRDDEVDVSKPRPYRPLETLSPQSYTIQLISNSFGRAAAISTGGSDIAGIHGYSLGVNVGLDDPRVSFGASYSYRRLWPDLRVAVGRNVYRRGGLVLDGQNTVFTEENWSLTAGMGLPVLRTRDGEGTLFLDYDFDVTRDLDDQFDGYDPNEAVPLYPRATNAKFGAATLRFSYSDVRHTIWTLGPREGIGFGGSLRFNDPALGSDFRTLNLSASFETFHPLPWGVTPELSLRVSGGIQTADSSRSGAYVLGGVPQQDIVQSIIDSVRANRSGYLRGYPARSVSGSHYLLANVEYRQSFFQIEKGLDSLPIYLRELHGALLFDAGGAWNEATDPETLKLSVGASLRLEMLFGYFVPGALDIGYARGLSSGGTGEYWMLLTGAL